jgi:NhaP-type Na+/H+ or K+/H+ antiporter
LPSWFLLQPWLPSLRSRRDTLFHGWFGPIGTAALFYAAEFRHQVDQDIVWPVASFIIFGSITLHGITATLWTHLYARGGNGRPAEDRRRGT